MSTSVPSPFGKLLRRSKFASYDPLIGQVYTTYGGHAHRGNWGLKRPLPNRRKTGFITVHAIDSKEQQTEWNSAESSARWIRRWDEMGKHLRVADGGAWLSKNVTQWYPDSEFNSNSSSIDAEVMSALVSRQLAKSPSMSPKQFDKHLDRLRSVRPKFKEFLMDGLKTQESKSPSSNKAPVIQTYGSGQVDMHSTSQNAASFSPTNFFKKRVECSFISMDSSVSIGSQPHIYAGLEPTVLSPLQIQYLYRPSPGRLINQHRSTGGTFSTGRRKVELATVGGIIGEVRRPNRGKMTDYGTTNDAGIDLFRVAKVHLVEPPHVVKRQSEDATASKFQNIEIFPSHVESNISNPYPLGSRAYVGTKSSIPSEARGVPRPVSQLAKIGKKELASKSISNISNKENLVENITSMLSRRGGGDVQG
ncbi:hypothetical protein Clacol_006571 [Clathrus columnatus]|uniref:Uncharacterized protein n=1 Tax=Clathrus columnatus TaxID=1419009 RepID=A0AAV5AD73_9AGAM|nr:hypothetical protein Clacol_006571 [Clathrus columnatus]